MTKSKKILIAVGTITGGLRRSKDAPLVPATLGDGEELTEKAATALGLDDTAIEKLLERGALLEMSARVAEPGDAADPAVALAERRVSELESERDQLAERVSELERELDALRKAAATTPAGQAKA